MSPIALFAYASLVDPASASRTLGRRVEAVTPARLGGWRRRWSQARDNISCEKTFSRADGSSPAYVLGLNVEPDPDGAAKPPNGALLALSEPELERLDLREIRYDRVNVTELVEVEAGGFEFDTVIAYSAKPENFAPEPPPGAVVLTSYASSVERAFDALGEGQRELYLRTTGEPPVEVVDGVLVDDRIPEGNPREW
jgi:cation transport regulator ChaC